MASFRAYYLAARNTWDETLTYRLNFAVWRLRVFLSLISTYFLWLVLLPKGENIAGYNQSSMLTYIVGGGIVYSIVLSTRVAAVSDDIVQGNLSNYLLRPVNYIVYYFFKDFGDKGMNLFFSFFEISLIFILLRPPFYIQTNLLFIFGFFLSIILAIVINFYLNMLLSFVGFFSSEAWAPRFIFFIILGFFSGTIFPLDILPSQIYSFLKLLPFLYLIYFPMKIYLGQIHMQEVFSGLLISLIWSVGLYFITNFLWNKGLHLYSAQGR
ncbi:MAG TPA: ABC-2 family transporter protein [Patescibacteria group bacterium]